MVPKLSKRLTFILKFIPPYADVFYDLCCDHGYLGIAVAHTYSYSSVNLIDQIPSIMEKVSNKIKGSYIPTKTKITSTCLDARKIRIKNDGINVVSIAGIGGELTIKIIDSLLLQLKSTDILVLSAHNNIHKLRQYLINNNFNLVKEGLVKDNGKFYEVLVLRYRKSQKSNIGLVFCNSDDLSSNIDVLGYYDEQIAYLENKVLYNPNSNYEEIIKSYSASKSKIN